MENVIFKVNRDNDRVIGFTLIGRDTDAQSFCVSFVRAQQLGKADIRFKGDEIIFEHKGVSLEEADPKQWIYGECPKDEFRTEVSKEDRMQLSQLLALEGPYLNHKLSVKFEKAWGLGFTLYVKK